MNFVKWMKHLLIIQFETLTVNTNAVVILVLFGSLSCLNNISAKLHHFGTRK